MTILFYIKVNVNSINSSEQQKNNESAKNNRIYDETTDSKKWRSWKKVNIRKRGMSLFDFGQIVLIEYQPSWVIISENPSL